MLTTFRLIAIFEGISYIVLLGIAMPFKYFAGYDAAVTVVGWAHGVLFVLYLILVVLTWMNQRWSFWRAFIAGAASVIPFAPFFLDRKIKREQQMESEEVLS